MSDYQPELGQMIFGQPTQKFSVPEIMEAALFHIRHRLDTVMWNIHQREYANPFGNTGSTFKNDVFEANAYSWSDDLQPFNFAWKDLRISWYKYLGRGMSANMEITPELAAVCLSECMASLTAMDASPSDQKAA